MKGYACIIENKSLKNNANKEKTKAWEAVHKSFNQLNSRPRVLKQLQVQWKAMKTNAKTAATKYKNELKQTGGGPKPDSPSRDKIEILDLLNPGELIVDDNIYDSDYPTSSVSTKTEVNKKNVYMDCEMILLADNTEKEVATTKESFKADYDEENVPTNLEIKLTEKESVFEVEKPNNTNFTSGGNKGPSSRKNNVNRRVTPKAKPNQTLNYVPELLKHSKALKEIEHKRKIEMAEEEHKIKIQCMMEEHLEKLKIMRTEHNINMIIKEEELKKIKLSVNKIND